MDDGQGMGEEWRNGWLKGDRDEDEVHQEPGVWVGSMM